MFIYLGLVLLYDNKLGIERRLYFYYGSYRGDYLERLLWK